MNYKRSIIDEIPVEIYKQLDGLGVPPHILGYDYIAYAVMLLIEDMNRIHRVTKDIYPEVARVFNTKPSRVERAIRHSITHIYTYGNMEKLNSIFFPGIENLYENLPTNSQFLSIITRRARREIMAESCDCEG